MEEVSILIIKEIAGLIFKKPRKTTKISDCNGCQRLYWPILYDLLTYITC